MLRIGAIAVTGATEFFAAVNVNADSVVQLLTVALIAAAAVPVLRSRQKDATIETLKDSAGARMERIKDLEAELSGTAQRADAEHEKRRECERRISHLEGKIEEQAKYTAKEAFETIVSELASLRTTIGESISSQGELILKNTELQAQAVQTLERVANDLEVFADRLRCLSPPATPDS